MLTVIADVFGAHRGVPAQSLLYFQVPLVITRDLHFAGVEKIEGRHRSAISKVGAERGVRGALLGVQVPCRPRRDWGVKENERGIVRRVGQDVIDSTGWYGIAEDAESTPHNRILGPERRPRETDLRLVHHGTYRGKRGMQSGGQSLIHRRCRIQILERPGQALEAIGLAHWVRQVVKTHTQSQL